MRACIVRMGMAVWLAGCLCQAVCQTDPASPDYWLYSALFQRVLFQSSLVNGQPTKPPLPSVQEGAGLTDAEMKALIGIAANCRDATDAVYRQHPHFVFDALMESIETGKDNSAEVQQLAKDMQDQAERVVMDHVQQLRTAFGDARFQALGAWLRADEASRPKTVRK
jgi:hypothetical protein